MLIKYLITFILGMCPIIEIRGAIPVGVGMGLSYFEAFIVGLIGNIIPIYFIVKYIGPIFDFFKSDIAKKYENVKFIGPILKFINPLFIFIRKIINWASDKATKHIESDERLQNYTALGLFIFVAIPIPGTGAWVGSLIANFLHMPIKKAWLPLALGVLGAGLIVLFATGSIVTIFQHI